MCKFFHRIIQRLCKGLNERAAAGRAGFVELDAVNGVVLDLYAFHVLSADVQDAVYVRLKKGRGIIVRHCFDLALIQKEGRLNKRFAVAGGAGVDDIYAFRQLAVDVFNGVYGSAQGVSVIIVVKRVQEGSVVAYQSGFCRGGAGVYPKECVPLVTF